MSGSGPREMSPAVVDAVLAAQRPWVTRIRCATCQAPAEIVGFGLDAVRSRTDLYCDGWRREPMSRLHYCPEHAPAVMAAMGAPR